VEVDRAFNVRGGHWVFRGGLARFFPEQWERLRAALPGDDPIDELARLLEDPDPVERQRAANAWCLWESAIGEWPPPEGLASRFADPAHRRAFARVVTHYVRHDLFLEEGALVRGATALAGIPGVIVNGSLDVQSPLANAWELKRAWPDVELVVVDAAGHTPTAAVARELRRATDRFAAAR